MEQDAHVFVVPPPPPPPPEQDEVSYTLAQIDSIEGAYEPSRPNDYNEFKAVNERVMARLRFEAQQQQQQ
ncbi:MAG: hypothetical protein IV100_15860, partial [Myxococcales bacterium]|nr:hypothetical protein [Myxococcales bacterium]